MTLSYATVVLAYGVDEALLIAVEPNGGEEAGAESSCIGRNAGGREHRAIADDRMAVDDMPGPDTGMHEEIPAIVMRQREVADEVYMAAEPVGYRQFIPNAGMAFQRMVEEEPRPVGNHGSSSDAAHEDQPLDDSIGIATPIHVVTHKDDLGARASRTAASAVIRSTKIRSRSSLPWMSATAYVTTRFESKFVNADSTLQTPLTLISLSSGRDHLLR